MNVLNILCNLPKNENLTSQTACILCTKRGGENTRYTTHAENYKIQNANVVLRSKEVYSVQSGF